jgi:hypothetical protein
MNIYLTYVTGDGINEEINQIFSTNLLIGIVKNKIIVQF